MRVPTAFLALAAVAAVAPASAQAATAYMEPGSHPTKAFFDAAPGEANELAVTYDPPSGGGVTLRDAGAVIQAVAPCEARDEHTVYCPSPPLPDGWIGWPDRVTLEARLGDHDDVLTTDAGGQQPFASVTARGGKGDDVLTGDDGDDTLDGGAGADHIRAGRGADFVSDGDRTGANPQPDVIDGGPNAAGEDTISYEHRTAGVTADLVRGVGGERGEGDGIAGFESAVGGAGDDTLTAAGEFSHLTGNAGDDTLTGGPESFNAIVGGAGDDTLIGGSRVNVLTGGDGLDTHVCGDGEDHVIFPSAGELLGSSCGEVDFSVGEFGFFEFPPYPVRTTPRAAWFRIGCPTLDGESDDFDPCTAVLKLRGRRGRLLGRGAFEQREATYRPPDPVRVKLTPRGRRLAARRHGVVATVSFSDRQTKVAWTIRLRTSR